ncbi:hypothetical protein AB0K60_25740 [Thermopolyspora sp. NPDC052614]|uniref:hypothetical protein n=1 Tax=Thermopolyspora sp. NPDC052614 TaxID=3155682 RepID=UPI0034228C47
MDGESRGKERPPLVFDRDNDTLTGAAFDMEEWLRGMDRRTFNEMAVGLAALGAIPQVPDRVDMAHVNYLRSRVQQISSGYKSTGGNSVLAAAVKDFAWARLLLEDSDYSDANGRQLLAATAELGAVAGWAAYDGGRQELARRLYGEAELLAGSAENIDVSVYLYAHLSQQSMHLAESTGRPGLVREALRFANHAAALARHEPSPRMHALTAIRQAYAHAALGDKSSFRSAIATARRELDRGPHPTDPAWTDFVTHSEITGYEGLGYHALARIQGDRIDHVPDLYRAAIEDPARSARDHVAYRATLAIALLEQGDTEQAISEATAVLPENSNVKSGRTLRELLSMRTAVGRIPAAEEFCARYDAAVRSLSA